MNRIEKDPFQKKLDYRNWFGLIILGIGSLLLASTSFTLGILCGGVISIVNYHLLNHSLKKAFQNVSDKTKTFLMVRYYIRFVITAVILYLLITRTSVDVIALLIGLSVVVLNIVFTTILEVSKKNLIPIPEEVN